MPLGPRGFGQERRRLDPAGPSWLARAPWGPRTRAFRVPLRRRQHGHRRRDRRQQLSLGPRGCGRRSGGVWTQQGPSWSARAPWGTPPRVFPCPSPPTATRPSSEGLATTCMWGRVGLDQERRRLDQQGPKLVGSGAVGTPIKAFPCPSPPTATRPSSEGPTTTVVLGPRGSGRGAAASGPSRDPSWSARAPRGTQPGLFRVPLRRR